MPLPQLQAYFDQPERRQLARLVTMILLVVILILGFMYLDRGTDVEYFKQRLYMQEQRLNTLDQQVNEANQMIHAQKKIIDRLETLQRETIVIAQLINELEQKITDLELADNTVKNTLVEIRRIQEQQTRSLEERKTPPKAGKKH